MWLPLQINSLAKVCIKKALNYFQHLKRLEKYIFMLNIVYTGTTNQQTPK